MRVLGLIPARGGSKGLPRKNIRLLHGKPLLEYTVEAARESRRLSRLILSTDDEEIAAAGRRCGLDVPFLRPADLARDETPTLPVIQHAVRVLESTEDGFDAVCLLQPTSPFRTTEDIDGCIELLEKTGADSAVTVAPVPAEYNPHWVYFTTDDGLLKLSTGECEPIARRQSLPPAYHRDGSVYVTKRDVIMEQNSLYGTRVAAYVVACRRSVNIDGPEDWKRAEALLSEVTA